MALTLDRDQLEWVDESTDDVLRVRRPLNGRVSQIRWNGDDAGLVIDDGESSWDIAARSAIRQAMANERHPLHSKMTDDQRARLLQDLD